MERATLILYLTGSLCFLAGSALSYYARFHSAEAKAPIVKDVKKP